MTLTSPLAPDTAVPIDLAGSAPAGGAAVTAPATSPPLDLTPSVPTAPATHGAPATPTTPPASPVSRPRTPAEAYAALLEGNARYTANAPHYPNHHTARRADLTGGQEPFAIVFSCADSRVPPELVFDRGLGDLFVVRTAGHAIGPMSIGTIDYAVEHLDTRLIAVVGHLGCGAVTATMAAHTSGERPEGNIGNLVDCVLPSVVTARAQGEASLDECVIEHVCTTVRELPSVSPSIASGLAAGELGIVGMVYHLDTGRTEVVSHLGDFRI